MLEAGRVGFTNFGEGVAIVDPYTGELKVPTKQDVADTAKVVDALPNVDVYERAVVAEDVDQRVAHLHQAEAWSTNTSKHGFMGSGNALPLEEAPRDGAAPSPAAARSSGRARSSRSSPAR